MAPRHHARTIIPRTVRTMIRRAYDATLDGKSYERRLLSLVATGNLAGAQDAAMMLGRCYADAQRLLGQIVGATTGRDDDEQQRLTFGA